MFEWCRGGGGWGLGSLLVGLLHFGGRLGNERALLGIGADGYIFCGKWKSTVYVHHREFYKTVLHASPASRNNVFFTNHKNLDIISVSLF